MLPNAYRSGHYFVGWYDRALSGGTCYTPETTAPARGNITLYARWEATGLPYQDISRDAWYFEAVSEATDRGLFQGTSETTFEPESTMNRAMLATVIYRMAGSPRARQRRPSRTSRRRTGLPMPLHGPMKTAWSRACRRRPLRRCRRSRASSLP